jgi:AraC family transcriptional regulator of adaptative response / DNA-3-methyladenine glycosylase II
MLKPQICQKARLSRDPRFDGKFFTAVKTTGIYCRSICPVSPPKEENVVYFATAVECANAGFRPCLRCRPDSARDSPAWKGVSTTLVRAISLINEGALQQGSMCLLAERLGISDRYLRQLFNKHIGMSPKAYALYQQCLFAKQLLHQTTLPITQIALASGFNSVRRFNDCFKSQMQLTPSAVRHTTKTAPNKNTFRTLHTLQLQLHYRPPYHWQHLQRFLSTRAIPQLEWCDDNSYGRTFEWLSSYGYFTAHHVAEKNKFTVDISVNEVNHLKPIVNNIRRILDVDADTQRIETDLAPLFFTSLCNGNQTAKSTDYILEKGLRLPGIWNVYEAGIRAILGQQVSVAAAHRLVENMTTELGHSIDDNSLVKSTTNDTINNNTQTMRLFPSPANLAECDFDFFKMPRSRKQTLRNLSLHYLQDEEPDKPDNWNALKGIGPWTINYAKLRGLSDPDIFLAGDLGIKKAMQRFDKPLAIENASPWGSYLTMHMWNSLQHTL